MTKEERQHNKILKQWKRAKHFGKEISKNDCPICEYPIKLCQCKYGGTAHPSRNTQKHVVLDHLYLLSRKQLRHVISLEAFWQTSSLDDKYTEHLKKLETAR